MEKVGLLAGVGRLPVECAKAAKDMGYEVCAVALLPDTDPELKEIVSEYTEINVARLGEIIAWLKANGIRRVTMIGKVTKELLFSGQHAEPDATMMQLLATLPDRKDDTIMLHFVAALAHAGMQALDQTALIRRLMPQHGVLTARKPTEKEQNDLNLAYRMAREDGRLDVGQTAVVKDMAVMALEAIEGTDECIKRGGKLARGGAVVAKVAKPNQDMRFDVPTVGMQTIRSMIESGATALAIEAGKTLLVEKDKVVALADENDIAIVGM